MQIAFNRVWAGFARSQGRRSGSIIVPSAAPGSIGDDAMVMSLVTSLHEASLGPIRVLARGGSAKWPDLSPAAPVDMPTGRLRGIALAKLFAGVERVFVVGADCMDGHYSVGITQSLVGCADLAARVGASATIVGFSFKDSPVPAAVKAIQSLHRSARLCGRDPRTVERLRKLTGRDCELVTDTAFMLRPTLPDTPNAARDLGWIARHREGGSVLLGINFNRQVFGHPPDAAKVDAMFDAHAAMVNRLLDERPELAVVMIPHDYRGEVSDCDHARMLAERIAQPDRVMALTDQYRASQIKHFGSLMDLVLTGRMHLAIESLGAGVPVACVTYQDKFEGLFDHFRLEPITLSPEALTADSLHAMVSGALDRRVELRAHVAGQLDRVRAMSRLNLGLGAASPAGVPAEPMVAETASGT